MRMGNPSVRRWVSKSQHGETGVEIQPATYKGVYGKAALFAFITIITAIVAELAVYTMMKENLVSALVWVVISMVACAVPLVIMSLVIAFVPSSVKVLGIIYSILQGGLLGCMALFVDIFYPGISIAALLGTAIVFLISLAVNKLLEVRISNKFIRGCMVVFFSLIVVELFMLMFTSLGLFSYDGMAMWWIQTAISAICIIWATIMLVWDLQNIDCLVQSGADKKYEWNFAFSLVTTLVYLYVEILELLLRLIILFNSKRN